MALGALVTFVLLRVHALLKSGTFVYDRMARVNLAHVASIEDWRPGIGGYFAVDCVGSFFVVTMADSRTYVVDSNTAINFACMASQ